MTRIHRTWVVEVNECYTDHRSSKEAWEHYNGIELMDGDYKYIFIAHDDESGNFYPELDVGLAYEER